MSYGKSIFFIVVLVSAFAGACYIDPTKISTDALSAICTIFSVLAGLILAIYALHISSIDTAHNKDSAIAKTLIWDSRKAVNRLSYFFWLYLVVLSLALIMIIGDSVSNASENFQEFFHISARLTVFFAILAAGMSFFVPSELKYIQERKILEAEEDAKESAQSR